MKLIEEEKLVPHRYRIHLILICVVLVIIFLPHVSDPPDKHVTQLATAAATEFLEQIDTGNYGNSWELSAAALKMGLSRQDWEQQLSRIRSATGGIVERQQKEISYANAPAEDPDAQYLLIEYSSRFARTEEIGEAITMTLEKDGYWRVAGYHINR